MPCLQFKCGCFLGVDANSCETDLATRQGNLITDENIAEDWQDIIVPDLRESFTDDLHYIQGALEATYEDSDGPVTGHWVAFHLLEHDLHHRSDIFHYLALLEIEHPDVGTP